MFRFEDPAYLYLLAIVPILGLLHFMMQYGRKRKLRRFGEMSLLNQLMPEVSRWRPWAKFWLLEGALTMLIVMVARPQMGSKVSNDKRAGIETVIAMDISNSMLAEDVEPCRLDRAKMMVENLVDKFTDDKIALLLFAGDAFIQLPITSDYVSAKMFLNDVSPSLIATQGTDIARAIDLASHSFTQQEGIGRAIIIITDGEDHEGGAIEAAKAAQKKGMRVFVLGIGSPKGSPIPDGNGGYMKDNAGNVVMSGLNEDMCRQIAQAGGGAYIHVDNNSNAQEQLNAEVDKLSKKEINSVYYSEYDEQFQAFGVIAVLLLLLEVCVLERKNPLLKNVSFFTRKKVSIVLILFGVSATMMAQTDREFVRQGNRHFRQGNYAEAEVSYRKALEKNAHNPQATYNLGNVLFAQKKDSAAVQQFEQAVKLENNPQRRAMAFHNLGVVCQSHQMYGEAIEAYKEALRLVPQDNATRYNLELCKRQQKRQQQNQNQQKQQQKNQKNQSNKDKQQKKENQDQQKQKSQQKPDENKMSKDNAEQLLNAAIQQEKSTKENLKKALQKPSSRKLQKNW